jgi:lysophospholipase L1-like esterase
MSLTNKVAQFTADSDLVNEWVHGGSTTSITTDSGPVRSPAKLIADLDASINVSGTGVLALATAQAGIATTKASDATTQATLATNEKIAAITARTAAELAAANALISVGSYTTEALGRAAVADGAAFKVQGSGDVAAYEYRRTNSTTSVLIATYPSITLLENTLENFNGYARTIIGSDHPIALTRGNYKYAGIVMAATIFGWASAFLHNGSAFNVVQTNLRGNAAGRIRVEICRGSAPLVPIAYGYVEVTTTARNTTVVLNKTVRDAANNEVMYIRIYDPSKIIGLAYGDNIRTGSDPDATTYPDQYWYAGGWSTASPASNYRIDFRLVNTNLETRILADDLKIAVGIGAMSALLPNVLTNAPVFSRGSHDKGGANTVVSTIFGWRSPFKHNGKAFNTVQLSLKDGGTTAFPITVEILSSDAVTVLGTGTVIISGGSTVGTYTVALDRLVTELALNSVGYIQYYDPARKVGLGYPTGGAYTSDADPAVYLEKALTITSWSAATPIGNYRINFRLFNSLASSDNADGLIARTDATGAIVNGFIPYFTYLPVGGVSELDGNNTYYFKGAIGTYELVRQDFYATALDWRIWTDNAAVTVEWRAYVRDSTTVFDMDATARVAEGNIAGANFPKTNTLFRLNLGKRIKCAKGQYLFILFRAVKADGTDNNLYMGRWDTAVANDGRHSLLVNVSGSGWAHTFANGTYPAYCASGFRAINESDEFQNRPTTAQDVVFTPTALVAASTVQAAIAELSVAVENVTAGTTIILPPTIYGLEGKETNIYFDNLLLDDAASYNISAIHSASSGVSQNHRWTWTPAGSVTTGALTISLNNKRSGLQIVAGTTNTYAAAASAGTGTNKKVIVIGDSLIGGGVVTQTLVENAAADAMGITLYGTQGTGSNLHEGRGGWAVYDYTGAGRTLEVPPKPNPFWDGSAVNFANYLTVNSIPAPDWVFISLGINDCADQVTDASAISNANTRLAVLATLINSIKAADPNTKVGLMLATPPSAYQDSFGANYGASTLLRWRFKRSILLWVQRVLAIYANQQSSRIYIVPVNVNLDTVYNMLKVTTVANARNTTSVERQSNGVHPATSGYQQMADAVWAFMKYHA